MFRFEMKCFDKRCAYYCAYYVPIIIAILCLLLLLNYLVHVGRDNLITKILKM